MACSETYTKSNSAEDDVWEEDALRPEASSVDKMNFFELSDMCKSLDIGIPESKEDCKQRLKNHLFSGQRREVHGQKMLNMVQKTIKKYKDKKKMLIDQYSRGTNIIKKAIFVQEMQKGMEERIENFAQKLGKGTKELNELSDEFEIVIIGETSSGKSTFLNVLLEEDILPWHLLHTTSCLCRLHNSVQRQLEFTAKKGSVKKTIAIKEPNELSKTLRELMKSVNQHDKSLDVMDIYWPIPWLQQNVVLVDTPGIGEKNDLTKLIIEYVPKAAGYIFVVDTSNAGGVKEGGIVQLIEGIKLSADKTGSKIKDMSNLLFVCNKWDLVGRENIEEVSQNIQEKLHHYCDPLQDWQVVVFDAKTELKIQKWKANPTKNFEIIVGSLEELMIQTIERRLRQKFQWILSFSTVLRDIVDARLNALLMTDTELHEKVEKSKKSLEDASHTLELDHTTYHEEGFEL